MKKVFNQLRLPIIMLFLFAILNMVAMYHQIDSMSNDGKIVNYAGIVRGGTQRLIKLEILQQDTDNLASKLKQIVKGLINGDQELQLIKAQDQEFQAKMQQIEQFFPQIEAISKEFRHDPNSKNLQNLLAESEDYWNLTNAAVSSAEAFAKHNVQNSKHLTIILFFVNLLVLVVVWKISENIESRLKRAINTLATSSTEISATVEEQERVASLEAASVNETTATMDELEASCRQAAEQAKAAVAAVQQALHLVQEGTQAVGENLEGMFTLEKKVGIIAEQIVHLSEQANQIGSISHLVFDLANQTNMLALNSSVEAIRAGEHDKGFAVVANEIRKLADQSQRSAEKINVLVSQIQNATNSTVMLTEEGTKMVRTEVQIAQKTKQVLTGMADAVNNLVLNNQQISLNLKQQVDGIQQVVHAMESINHGAKEAVNGIGQTRFGIQQLNEAALDLKRVVS